MKYSIIKIVILFLISVSGICFSQNGWVQQSSGTTLNLHTVHFINSNTGWICGNAGVILHTTNGGTNWSNQNSTTNLTLYSIMFADENTGWAVGGNDYNNPSCSHSVIVLKTTNGGATWLQQISSGGFLFNDLYVVDNQTAYICNAGACCPPFCVVSAGGVLRTTNAGQNWSSSIIGASYSLFFLDTNNGWALKKYSSDVPPGIDYIYRTSNAGNNWVIVNIDTNAFFSSLTKNIFFTSEETGYLHRGSLLKTTNGGISWNNTDSISTSNVNYHYFVNEDTGWCCGGSGNIIRTDNGGANWTTQISNTTSSLSSIYFDDVYNGWIVGSGGTILKTITGGLTSVKQSSSSMVSSFELKQNYPNPFNPVTVIKYEIPSNVKGQTSNVKIVVYDALGNEIITLVDRHQNPGSYSVEFDGSNYSSGIYFYKLEAEEYSETRRMVLLK